MSAEQALCRAKLEHLLTEIEQSIAEKKTFVSGNTALDS